MQLAALIRSVEVREVRGAMDLDIRDITYHSHLVKEGDLFVAVKGEKADGHDFIRESIGRGARAVVCERLPVTVPDVPLVVVQDSRKALALISDAFFNHPSREMTLVGITGTSGKTTTSYLIESIMKAAGKTVGVIGTIN
jgi:UDP-N-acetylmuramoyl-L-alanyl-D-glutamate--2,6-diaminopimelate ligase